MLWFAVTQALYEQVDERRRVCRVAGPGLVHAGPHVDPDVLLVGHRAKGSHWRPAVGDLVPVPRTYHDEHRGLRSRKGTQEEVNFSNWLRVRCVKHLSVVSFLVFLLQTQMCSACEAELPDTLLGCLEARSESRSCMTPETAKKHWPREPTAVRNQMSKLPSLQFLVEPANWLRSFSAGLSAVAVALVADAAYSLSKKLCKSRVTIFCCAVSAGITYYYASQWIFPTLIAIGERAWPLFIQERCLGVRNVSSFLISMTGTRHWQLRLGSLSNAR